MKNSLKTFVLILLGLSISLNQSCKKENSAPPVLTTAAVTEITNSTAVSGGNITNAGDSPIISKGICWSTSTNPTITDNLTTQDGTPGAFTSILTNLTSNTDYYVRAYATNNTETTYGNELKFTTLQFGTVTDIDGNNYKTVNIGTQVWMTENLKVIHYRNNEPIPNITDNTEWNLLTTGAYCDYDNNPTNSVTYGKLYNFYSVVDARNLCPIGWHVPSDAEWTILTDFLGGINVAGGKMKEAGLTHWRSPNASATNESNFSALPGGYRNYEGLSFAIINWGSWWTSTEYNTGSAINRSVNADGGEVRVEQGYNKPYGFSVRCLKDS